MSNAEDFQGDSHFRRLLSDTNGAADVDTKRLVLCTGKVAYDLIEARDAAGDTDTQIVRVEQLYPFPGNPIAEQMAAALGDIGEHYPDTDPEWRDLDSTRLLAEVVERVAAEGWKPVNCDVIIHAQSPKLGPHKATIRSNLARLLGLADTAVNVKAKTGERVGPIGRGEAISCEAVVLLVPVGPESAGG